MGTLQIDPAKAEDNIEIKVYDDDFGAENFIGSYYLPVKEAIDNSGVGGVWYDLRDCKNGKICVSAQFNASDSKINKKEIVGMSQEEKSTETSKEKEEGIAKSKEVDSKIDSKEQLLDAKEGEMITEKEEQTKNETQEIKEKTSQRDEKKEESLIKTENGEESKPTEKADVKEVNETDSIYSKRDD